MPNINNLKEGAASGEMYLVGIVGLEELDDIELVVVLGDVGLVQHDIVHVIALVVHVETVLDVRGTQRVHRRLALLHRRNRLTA